MELNVPAIVNLNRTGMVAKEIDKNHRMINCLNIYQKVFNHQASNLLTLCMGSRF